jgi:hypothetical protein
MAINCLSPISHSALRRVWVRADTEVNPEMHLYIIFGTGYCNSAASQPFIDLITHIPLPLIKREEGLLAVITIH